jgi:Ca2+-binding EF-hand superfamily protein
MAEVDKNGDGQISYNEFSEAMTKVLLQQSTWKKLTHK